MEILVVLGLIIALIGILLPMVNRAYRNGERARAAADLQAIAAGLEAYKQDFGDYPRARFQPGLGSSIDRPNPPTGAQILCFALVGNAPESEPGGAPAGVRGKQDGAQGPGFRTRRPVNGIAQGKVYGPYIPVEKFKISTNVDGECLMATLVDRYRRPILYFPSSPAKPNITLAPGFVAQNELALFDANDNVTDFRRSSEVDDINALRRLRLMLGDNNANGLIDGTESAASTGPYILWSAGPDEQFGPDADNAGDPASPLLDAADVVKCDDVVNFR